MGNQPATKIGASHADLWREKAGKLEPKSVRNKPNTEGIKCRVCPGRRASLVQIQSPRPKFWGCRIPSAPPEWSA